MGERDEVFCGCDSDTLQQKEGELPLPRQEAL